MTNKQTEQANSQYSSNIEAPFNPSNLESMNMSTLPPGSPTRKKKPNKIYGVKLPKANKTNRSSIAPSYAIRGANKKSQRISSNRSPQLMDWIMIDNSVKPFQEHKRQKTLLAPINFSEFSEKDCE